MGSFKPRREKQAAAAQHELDAGTKFLAQRPPMPPPPPLPPPALPPPPPPPEEPPTVVPHARLRASEPLAHREKRRRETSPGPDVGGLDERRGKRETLERSSTKRSDRDTSERTKDRKRHRASKKKKKKEKKHTKERREHGASLRRKRGEGVQRATAADVDDGAIDGAPGPTDLEKRVARDVAMLREDPRARVAPQFGASAEQLSFRFDVKPDADNLVFGCPFKGHVPKYRTLLRPRHDATRGRRLGRPAAAAGPVVNAEVLRRRYRARLAADQPVGTAPPLPSHLLPPPRPLAAAAEIPLLDSANGDEPTAGGASGAAGELTLGDDAGGDGGATGGALYDRLRSLNARTRACPTDETAWLHLASLDLSSLDHAPDLDLAPEGGGGAGGGAVGGRRRGAVAERRVAVLSRALAANPDSERLQLSYLEAQEALLPAAELLVRALSIYI